LKPPPPTKTEKEPNSTAIEPSPEPLALTLDLELYLGQLDDWDISEAQKIEFISTFWNLLVSFAELGFGIHPAQLAQDAGRKKPQKPPGNCNKSQDISAICAMDMLYSEPHQRTRIIPKSEAHNASAIEDSKPEGTRA
jgi:hypothetical protein